MKRTLVLEGAAAELVHFLDEDAAEAAALAHDLGHPPFGHLAEEELDRLASGYGGFEGNAQSFRIVTRLALQSPATPGLNLTRRTLNGVLKYPWPRDAERAAHSEKWGAYESDRQYFEWVRLASVGDERSLEAQVMDWADDVTYAVHDLDDFYRAGLVPLDRRCQADTELSAFKAYMARRDPDTTDRLLDAADRLFRGLLNVDARYSGRVDERINLRALGSALITRYMNAVRLESADLGRAAFAIDDAIVEEVEVLKYLTWFYVIERPSLSTIQRGQRAVIAGLFEMYFNDGDPEPRLFPPFAAQRLEVAETPAAKARIVVDLIAGMTEASALDIYRRATGVASGSWLTGASNL